MEENVKIEKLEETQNVKKKNNKGLVIVIILFALIILCLIGYICYDKGIIFNAKENKELPEKVTGVTEEDYDYEKLNLNDERFVNIYEKLKNYTYKQDRRNSYEEFTNKELATIAISDLKGTDFTKTNEVSEWGDSYYLLSSTSLVNNLKKYFREDAALDYSSLINENFATKVDFNGSGMTFLSYDSTTANYKVRFSGMGGTTGPTPQIIPRKIISAERKNDVITVTEKAIYYETSMTGNTITYKIYKDSAMNNLIDTKVFDFNTISEQTISVETYLDEAATITSEYTRIYNNQKPTNNYYFESSVIE